MDTCQDPKKRYFKGKEIGIVNGYKYLGFTLTTKLSFDTALEEYARRGKDKVAEILKTMWALGNMDMSLFFKLFDAQVKPMFYASEL